MPTNTMTDDSTIAQFKDDFRYDAMQASVERMEREGIENRWSAPFSFCLPTGNSVRGMWWTEKSGGMLVAALLIPQHIFLLLHLADDPEEDVMVYYGFYLFLIVVVLSSYLTRWLIHRRTASRRRPFDDEIPKDQRILVAIHKQVPRRFRSSEIDDVGYLYLDSENNRVIIIGVVAEYQIVATDVIEIGRPKRRNPGIASILFHDPLDQLLNITITDKKQSTDVIIYSRKKIPSLQEKITVTLAPSMRDRDDDLPGNIWLNPERSPSTVED